MKLSIIAVGSKMPDWVEQGYREYARRLPREMAPNLVELPLANRSKSTSVATVKAHEAQQILSAVPSGSHMVALEVTGKAVSTEKLADKISNWRMDGRPVAIVIGGPDGLATECLQRANEQWSLSALTLPHPLVRVVLIEQLYRAWTILQNHPYHK